MTIVGRFRHTMTTICLVITFLCIFIACNAFRPSHRSSRIRVTVSQNAFRPSHRSSRIRVAMSQSFADFDASGVRMNRGSSEDFEKEGSTLVSTRPFAKDDIMIKIPLAMCILAHRCGVISGTMQGQTDLTFDNGGDLRLALSEDDITQGRTWDINLALALLDATSGGNLAGDFWEFYCGVYPLPKDVTVPFTLPPSLLEECQNPTLYKNAMAQQERLSSLFPLLKDTNLHRFTQEYRDVQMTPLQWAFAMVRSRCFSVPSSGGDWFAQVPIIELCNHDLSDKSNAQFEGQVTLNKQGFPTGYVYLRAKTDIAEGSPVTISYDDNGEEGDYSNERLWTQYGFILDDHLISTKDSDLIPWHYLTHEVGREKGGSGIGRYKYSTSRIVFDGLIDALVDSVTYLKFNPADDGYAEGSVLEQVSCALNDRMQSAIGIIGFSDSDSEVEFGSVKEALLRIQQDVKEISSLFSTTLEHDVQLCDILNQASSAEWVTLQGEAVQEGGGDKVYNRVQYSAVVRYRIDRKKALAACMSVLDAALSTLE